MFKFNRFPFPLLTKLNISFFLLGEAEESLGTACFDRADVNRCRHWRKLGYCSKSIIRNTVCRKSCGSCGGDIEDQDNVKIGDDPEDFPKEETSEDGSCRDTSSGKQCAAWKLMGGCSSDKVKNLCQKACGVCFPDEAEVPCTDQKGEYRCLMWRELGFCTHDKMRSTYCRKSCGSCNIGKLLSLVFLTSCHRFVYMDMIRLFEKEQSFGRLFYSKAQPSLSLNVLVKLVFIDSHFPYGQSLIFLPGNGSLAEANQLLESSDQCKEESADLCKGLKQYCKTEEVKAICPSTCKVCESDQGHIRVTIPILFAY